MRASFGLVELRNASFDSARLKWTLKRFYMRAIHASCKTKRKGRLGSALFRHLTSNDIDTVKWGVCAVNVHGNITWEIMRNANTWLTNVSIHIYWRGWWTQAHDVTGFDVLFLRRGTATSPECRQNVSAPRTAQNISAPWTATTVSAPRTATRFPLPLEFAFIHKNDIW